MGKKHATSTQHAAESEEEYATRMASDHLLHCACATGDLVAAEAALAAGHAVDAVQSEFGWQPIHWACQEGHLPLVKLLVEHGACLLYTSPSPRDKRQSRMPSSA